MPTFRNLHDARAEQLDPSLRNRRTISTVALGDDGSAVSVTDNGLGNRLDSISIAEVERDGNQLIVSAFVDSTEFNGETLREAAVEEAAGGRAFAGDTFESGTEIAKDNAKSVRINFTLETQDASEL